jgi:DNA-binding response OmpR family regulator
LIDDSATIRAALSARLTIRGHEVRAAGSLAETTKALAEFDPEFVISDVRMPDVEGDNLCRRIKVAMRRPIPVILYSSLPKRELSARAQAAGADGYVCKSEGIDALVRRMDELMMRQDHTRKDP